MTPVPDEERTPERVVITTAELFAHGAREVIIRHGREDYCLRITRADKLILTK